MSALITTTIIPNSIVVNTFAIGGICWLFLTFGFYWIAIQVSRFFKGNVAFHPIIVTALLVALSIQLSGTSVMEYQMSASLLHWFLGPVTVALALPIYRQWHKVKRHGWRLLVCIGFGGVIAPSTAWLSLFILDAPMSLQLTMLVKSITTPLAMESSAQIGGIPALAAVFVIITGIVGAISSGFIFDILNIQERQAQGVALGTVAHAIGTAKAVQMGEEVAAISTLALCINGIFTAFIIPLLLSVLI